uniref:F-box protein AT5G49610-like beta-propeller domain-containing protein n=1 Tax=Aegilops tauschii subsp. strangulata TaxID=200361 RepID=A0A453N574_AEGTS
MLYVNLFFGGCCYFRFDPVPNSVCVDGKRLRQSAMLVDPVSKIHPPRLLGVYFKTRANRSRFVPMLPQPPENDAVISCASSGLDAHKLMLDDWNDIIFTKTFNNCNEEPGSIHIVRNPLCPARGMVIVPPFPCYGHQDSYFYKFYKLLFEEEGDSLSYFCVQSELSNDGRKSTVYVYMLQDGVWCLHASPTTQLPCRP